MSSSQTQMIKYHNDMNTVSFSLFNNREQSLFFSICSLMSNQGLDKVIFSFDQIKKLSSVTFQTEEEFIKHLVSTNNKFMKLNGKFERDGKIIQFVLFPTFIIDPQEKKMTIGINQEFSYILNEVTRIFTIFELQEFNSLKSTYSKHLFRLLKQFKSTGFMAISIEEFKNQLGYPEWYKICDIDKQVLRYCIKELPRYFPDLEIKKMKEGRRIKGFQFTFTSQSIEPKERIMLQSSREAECPLCNGKLQEIFSKENNAVFWGHRNYQKGSCRATFSNLEEIVKVKRKIEEQKIDQANQKEILKEIKIIVDEYPQFFDLSNLNNNEVMITNMIKNSVGFYPISKDTIDFLKKIVKSQIDKEFI